MSKQTPSNKKPGSKGARPPIDPLLLQRLEDLGQRRPSGAPLPPPAPGTAARSGGNAKASAARPQGAAKPRPNGPAPAPGSQEAKLAAAAARSAAARAAKAGGQSARAVPSAGRKGKPAASSKVAALAVSVASTAALVGMFARQDGNTSDSVILTGGTAAAGASGNTTAATTATTVAPAGAANTAAATTAPATTVAAANTIKDGTYVGGVSQNRWGPVQVQVVYAGGQITDVQILQYPNDRNRSVSINQYALPILIQETIQAQSSNINGVGGATYTSNSYYQSLQSALDTAKTQSGVTG
ncbi:MAG: hypothetical protein RJA49_1916 [Actinomycetota bacterium]